MGTVREDCSAGGDAWSYFPHDHARPRAYRWGEDGLGGVCDEKQRLRLALAPRLSAADGARGRAAILAGRPELGLYECRFGAPVPLLFTGTRRTPSRCSARPTPRRTSRTASAGTWWTASATRSTRRGKAPRLPRTTS
ncbi:hypothetical protein ACFV29_26975 [Streptomyces sp. NPDC059690]|uniref:hypothetical protein n=1 Tax=Streptomyces sp. NPDC059690 TaxID=3346907 RepID=UPI0036B23A6F